MTHGRPVTIKLMSRLYTQIPATVVKLASHFGDDLGIFVADNSIENAKATRSTLDDALAKTALKLNLPLGRRCLMNSTSSAVLERSPNLSTHNSQATSRKLTPQEFADQEGEAALEAHGARIAKMNRGEAVKEQ